MTNPYYTATTAATADTLGRAALINTQFQSVEAGFDAVATAAAGLAGTLATSATSWTPATGAQTFTLEDARTIAAGGYMVRRVADPLTFGIVDLATAITAGTTFTVTVRKINDNTSTGPYTDWVILGLGGTRTMPVVTTSTALTVAAGHLACIVETTGASALAVTLGS